MRYWTLFLVLAGCTTGVENRGLGLAHGNHSGDERPSRKRLDVTLVNHCAHPVEVCYGKDHCLSLPDQKPQLVHADTLGGSDVFVSLKGTDKSVFANITFDEIEVDETCQRLERHIGSSQPPEAP